MFLTLAQGLGFRSLQTPAPGRWTSLSTGSPSAQGANTRPRRPFMVGSAQASPMRTAKPHSSTSARHEKGNRARAPGAARQRRASRAIVGTFLGDILGQGQRSCRDTACEGLSVLLETAKLRMGGTGIPGSRLASWVTSEKHRGYQRGVCVCVRVRPHGAPGRWHIGGNVCCINMGTSRVWIPWVYV